MRPQSNPMVLTSPDRLLMCMERTGDGSGISIRELADATGVHHSKIDHLRTGRRKTATEDEAKAIARRCGVDLMWLWDHAGRSVPAPAEPDHEHLAAVPA